ncbi:MAG: Maf family protein [Bdellovibrionota bacterium]
MALVEELVLASSSKFRQNILSALGLEFRAQDASINEYEIVHVDPFELSVLRAKAKARAVATKCSNALVIGCDQTLEFGGHSFDKAVTAEEAAERLRLFAGSEHKLHSAVVFAMSAEGIDGVKVVDAFVSTSLMRMRSLTGREIDRYIASGEWEGSVGCYQAENLGANLFASYGEDLHSIMGVPSLMILSRLRNLGINPLLKPNPPWDLNIDSD